METVYVTFKVEVHDNEYGYQSDQKGEAEVKMQLTREILDSLDPGNIFIGALAVALTKFDQSGEPKDEEKD